METLFENQYQMTKERYFSFYKNPIKMNYMKIMWIVFMIISLVMAVMSVVGGQSGYFFYYGLILLFAAYNAFFRQAHVASKTYKKLVTQMGGDAWQRDILVGDKIIMKDLNTLSEFHWNQISHVVINQEYVALVLVNDLAIRLDKKGFVKGSYQDFVEYLKGKNLRIKGKIEE